jgi:lipopolysaccharide/colanic/teichoic acid biosynthesis glycosyltransferase
VQKNSNQLSFDEWLELDIKYIRQRSFLTDWKIMFATIATVFRMDGV